MQDKKQRKMLIIADMIVSGESEGSLLPNPKDAGIIAMGMNLVCFDEALSAIMGSLLPSSIPFIYKARNIKYYAIAESNETIIISNNSAFNMKKPNEISYEDSIQFKPSSGGKDH